MYECVLAIGTNLGHREQNIVCSLSEIYSTIASSFLCCSSIVETQALVPHHATVTWDIPFLNCVVAFRTKLIPIQIFHQIKNIEQRMGRDLLAEKWSPRIIDIDIIMYDNTSYQDAKITIPHPEMHKRLFVIKPLCEIMPNNIHPILNKTFATILAEIM